MQQNWLERGIHAINPEWALRRLRARSAYKIMSRHTGRGGYDAARRDRRTENWNPASGSADSDLVWDIDILRDRARDVLRNNPYAAKGVSVIVDHVVSTGITPRIGDENLNSLWKDWTGRCDADGMDDFVGIQALVKRSMIESGEVIIRMRTRRIEDGFPVPLQLQVLEADYIDSRKNERLKNGNIIANGIEFDQLGRRAAYWLFPEHPGAQYIRRNEAMVSKRVDADDIIHLFLRERPGQTRGVSLLARVLLKMKELQDYDDAELLRKRIEACFGIFIQGSNELGSLGPVTQDSNRKRLEEIQPAMIHYMAPGEEVSFGQPAQNQTYNDFIITQLRAAAAGLEIPYELLTGDLSSTSYSSIRGGMLPFRNRCEVYRWRLLVPRLCWPIWNRFYQLAELSGAWSGPKPKVEWTAPRYEWVDPIKDITAEIMAVRGGLMSLREAITRQGYDPDQLMQEISEDNKKLDDLGIVLDTDPRHVTQSGAAQSIISNHLEENSQ